MVNSSPEYLITKPGMAPQRKREKPLRTYGKRSASVPEPRSDAPPAKKRRLGHVERQEEQAERTGGLEPSGLRAGAATTRTEAPPPVALEGPTKKRTSILSYFRPMPTSASSPTSRPVDVPSVGANSPPMASRLRRKRRVLRLRAEPLSSDEPVEADAAIDECTREEDRKKGRGTQVRGRRNTRGSAGRERPGAESRDPLRDGGTSLLNQRPATPPAPKRGRRARPQASQAVQTTLNISARAAFSECKVCDSVWNPLYPDDVKYHTKRHAAVLRARRREEDEVL